ncbi:MAG: ABC transporter ATP-binding protein, partial [Planctomycetia bacterium]|nr:ABC transporter ATP-binding protein [Planctomycetia bacterium]
SSPPAWLRPYRLLSTGQQFRAETARRIACALYSPQHLVVFDEFTSTVDRTVAQLGSAAVAKAVRKHGIRFIAVTCHEDVLDWLQPDWTYHPGTNRFDWRLLQRRPTIALTLFRCQRQAWELFAPHHYLSADIQPSAICFLATWRDAPVAFSAWLPYVGKTRVPVKREHRTVCLPDYQGVGIGNAVSDALASMWAGLGFKPTSTTTHPAMIASRLKSPHWRLGRAPGIAKPGDIYQHAHTRLTAGFEYIGPALSPRLARLLAAR